MNDRDLTPAESAVLVLDEAENLIWALLDDHLDDASSTRLAQLLEEHESVRRRYLDCVQLHVDLQEHFAVAGSPADQRRTPILPGLTTGTTAGSDATVAP
jgi:anti-sigma factor RsiW